MSPDLKRVQSVSLLLIIVMLWQYGGGWTFAAARKPNSPPSAGSASPPKALAKNRFDTLLAELKEVIRHSSAKTKSAPEKGFADIGKLTELKESLVKENEKVQEQFDLLKSSLEGKRLPGEILNRHAESIREYEAKYALLMTRLESIESAQNQSTGWWAKLTGKNKEVDWNGLLGETLKFLEENTSHPAASHFDSKDLPHRALKVNKPLPPKLTREDWLKSLPEDFVSSRTALPSAVKAASATGSLDTTPQTPADLAETIDVRFTPEVRQLADSLGKNPVKIFNWVRNNIEFVPTWGSIQGSQLCFENRAGNAFDSASLLISLLRVSGIPARYQTGTITVPINKAMSWLGGVTDPKAAALLLSSGGIPSELITNQGAFVKIRLEHVWVKAFVDYGPSGGAVNTRGDTWVEIDPSFKQYAVTEGLDISSQVVFSRDQYLSSPSTVSPLDSYRQQIQNHLSANLPAKTLDDVLRKESIISRESRILASALPYDPLIRGQEFSTIPGSLRQTIKFESFADPATRDLDFSYTISLPELAGKRITLSYTPSDRSVAQSFNGMYFAPPYLIRLKPALRIDGDVYAQGQTAGRLLGDTHIFSISLNLPGGPGEEVIENEVTVGAYQAIVINPQKVTQAALDKISTRQIIAEERRLGVTYNIDNTDRDDLYGTLLHACGLLYFQRLDQAKEQAAALYKIRNLNRTYVGMFAFDLSVRSLFGRPLAIAIDRLSMDVDRIVDAPVSVNGNQTAAREFQILTGLSSSFLEHSIFDSDFSQTGFSAVKALQQARAEGIPIFEINSTNATSLLPQLEVADEVKQSILDNINRGRNVTVAKREVVIGGLRGVGYTMIDPETGDGSYLISVPNILSGGEARFQTHGIYGGGISDTPPDPCENRPLAILMIGTPTGFLDWFAGLNRHALDGVADTLNDQSYNVIIGWVGDRAGFTNILSYATAFEFKVDTNLCSPALPHYYNFKRSNIFIWMGHGDATTGFLITGGTETSGPEIIQPGDAAIAAGKFRAVYLAASQTFLSEAAWAAAFGAGPDTAVIGHLGRVRIGSAIGFSRCLVWTLAVEHFDVQFAGDYCTSGGIWRHGNQTLKLTDY